MSLANVKEMLYKAQIGHYAVPAFNIENMEMAMAVLSAAEETNSPIIMATSVSTLQYADSDIFYAMVKAICKKSKMNVALHLDHGDSFDTVMAALKSGYSSVMFDGSKMTYHENVSISRKITDVCHLFSIPVEGELGAIVGKREDKKLGRTMILTKPEMAKDYVENTRVDSLAVAIGTCHGFYREKPNLDYERLRKIQIAIDVPLVLHGASGLSDNQLRTCTEAGICKVNFATELRQTYTETIRKLLSEDKDIIDPKIYNKIAMQKVKEIAISKIRILGSEGKNEI